MKTKEEQEMEDFDDECDISSYRSSRFSMSLEGNMLQIERKYAGVDQSSASDMRASAKNEMDPALRDGMETGNLGILNHFQFRMKQINFEINNRERSLALRGPSVAGSLAGQVTVS